MLFFFIYWIIGYWAAGQTVYRNRIIIGDLQAYRIQRMTCGLFLGWILIPWALIRILMGR